MTPEAMRVAIAKACGWPELADALADEKTALWAMHEAERVLTPAQHEMFCAVLLSLTSGDDMCPTLDWKSVRRMIAATAAQRAKAFLLTIGKWEDET